jgi:hypothetical protein
MRPRASLVAMLALAASGCALLGFGPKTSLIQGLAVAAEDQQPLPQAEVCSFGRDTVCVRADSKGRYRLRLTAQTTWLRFRWGTLPIAVSDTLEVAPPENYTVSCALSNVFVLSARLQPCQPVAGR